MGTMLYGKGFFLNVCYDELNLKQPRLVQEVHAEYVRAGAEILETNTFGANPLKLNSYGLADETEKINRTAAELAGGGGGGRASVVGAIGPLGIRIEPFGPTSQAEAQALFARQVQGLLAGGVDGFVLETFSDMQEMHAALNAVRAATDLPVACQMTIGTDGLTYYGTDPETFTKQLTAWGADVIGVNCSVGPAGVLEAVEKMVKATDKPISAQPNAGLPKDVGDRKIYLASPEYMASYARRMIETGARFVGGCCGSTPEHIKKIRDYVASVVPRQPSVVVSRAQVQAPAGVTPVPLAEKSQWGAKLARGVLVTSVEIVPPKGVDPKPMLEQCRALKAAGVDAVNVPDGPRAQSRMGVLPSALLIEREVGIETVIHYCCRDRNLLGMLSDIIGAHAAAEFAVTQPVFDARQLEAFLKQVEQFQTPIVAGIWPLISLRNAEFLANEVPGVSVPDEVLQRMRKAQEKGKEAALAEGVAIAREMFTKVKQLVQGVQVSAPFGRVEVALQVFQ